ncbi:hypothetical protein C4559_05775 [Candidatus Microgenomates bacterium]|nr:MAG: hypothetical protein C4559_05775 [Candidatus Microgenomates bacterium]
MINDLKEHFYYYISLFGVIFLGVFLVLRTSFDKNLQMGIVVLIAFFYILLGLMHHFVNHDLKVKIVVEYILIGTLAVSIITFFLKTF